MRELQPVPTRRRVWFLVRARGRVLFSFLVRTIESRLAPEEEAGREGGRVEEKMGEAFIDA